jgi:hypothetical protein
MKFITQLKAIDPRDGEVKKWIGQTIEAPNFQLAEDYINKNGLGYLEIVGELVCSVDEETGNNISFENLN